MVKFANHQAEMTRPQPTLSISSASSSPAATRAAFLRTPDGNESAPKKHKTANAEQQVPVASTLRSRLLCGDNEWHSMHSRATSFLKAYGIDMARAGLVDPRVVQYLELPNGHEFDSRLLQELLVKGDMSRAEIMDILSIVASDPGQVRLLLFK